MWGGGGKSGRGELFVLVLQGQHPVLIEKVAAFCLSPRLLLETEPEPDLCSEAATAWGLLRQPKEVEIKFFLGGGWKELFPFSHSWVANIF